jgi:hypothetical protein
MHRFYPQQMIPDLWTHMETLIKENKLISHEVVFDEIVPKQSKKDELATWMSRYKSVFLPVSQRQMDLFPDILTNFPKLIAEESEKEQADPYLVAMIIEIMEQKGLFTSNSNYVIVSTESERSPNKLPAACKYYNILHLNLFQFFNANGFEFKVGNR